MDKVETGFLESQKLKPMVWTHGEQELQQFLQELNKTHPNLKFMHELSKEKISFFDSFFSLCNGNLIPISILKLLISISILNTRHLIQSTLSNPSFIVRLYV